MLKHDLSYELFSREPKDWASLFERGLPVRPPTPPPAISRVPTGVVVKSWTPPALPYNEPAVNIRKVDNDCFLPFPDLFVREGGEQE